jgi:acyl-CoA thioester hydrolase
MENRRRHEPVEDRQPPLSSEEFEFFHGLRVRWAEVDPQGIVFNANYLVYADVAFTEYMRAIGFPYPAGLETFGADLFVVSACLEYQASARFDEELEIGVRVDRIGRTSIRFLIGVFRDRELLVSIRLTYVNATREGVTPTPVPEAFVERVLAFEKREPSRA